MPAPAAKPDAPVALVCGEDDFAVKQRAKQIYQQWCEELGGMDHEIIEATVTNSGEALKALGRLREALADPAVLRQRQGDLAARLQFSRRRTRGANQRRDGNAGGTGAGIEGVFLAERAAAHQRRQGGQAEDVLQDPRQDRARRELSPAGRWTTRIGRTRRRRGRARASRRAPRKSANGAGRVDHPRRPASPPARQRDRKAVPLTSATGRKSATADVAAICTRNKMARAFALGDALGDRDLPRLLRCLDEELWDDAVRQGQERDRVALRFDFQGARDAVAEGNVARRLDSSRRRITTGSRRNWSACRRRNCRRTRNSIRWR